MILQVTWREVNTNFNNVIYEKATTATPTRKRRVSDRSLDSRSSHFLSKEEKEDVYTAVMFMEYVTNHQLDVTNVM